MMQGLNTATKQMRKLAAQTKGGLAVPVKNTPYLINIAKIAIGIPTILVPANQNRVSLNISQLTQQNGYYAFYSFGYPVVTEFAFGNVGGIIIPGVLFSAFGTFIPSPPGNGTISEDDLYVTVVGRNPNPSGFVIAYEGVLAIESERNYA